MALISEDLTSRIIGCAIEVHKHLGPGLLESSYEECLCYELSSARLAFKRQLPLPIEYKTVRLDAGYRLDLLIEDAVVLELKSVESVTKLHEAQLLTYMRLADKRLGLIINFNVPVLKDGITRRVL